MKTTNYLLIVLMAGMLALVGCGKPSQPAPTARTPGVVDLKELQLAFPAPTPEISGSLSRIAFAARYRQYETGLVELDKLTNIPNLTDAQKKAINEVVEQVKQAIAANPKPAQ